MVFVLISQHKNFCKRSEVIIFQSSSQMSFLQNFPQVLRANRSLLRRFTDTHAILHQSPAGVEHQSTCLSPLLGISLRAGIGASFLSMLGMDPGRAGSASTALTQLRVLKFS